jgi:hypothetical protein
MYLKLHKKQKLDVIAHSLTRCGITIWHGIPEQIVQDLYASGYKIKKRKRFKNLDKHPQSPSTPSTKIKSNQNTDDEIYL